MSGSEKKKIIILEPIDFADTTWHLFEENDIEITVGPHVTNKKDGYTKEQLIEFAREYDGMIGMSREKITKEVLKEATRLRVVGKYGIGVDHIDVEAASKANILVTNAPVITNTVAEFSVSLTLAVLKKLVYNDQNVRSGGWRNSSTFGVELDGKTIGFLGFGGIGRETAKRFSGWGTRFLAYDPYINKEAANALGAEVVDWDTIFRESDVVSVHMPLTDETESSISAKEFNMMKESAIIVNTARGKVIDQTALVAALKNKKIWGAGLDVFEKEPLDPNDELLKLDNVLVAAHTAGWSKESLTRMATQAAMNCIKAVKGEKPDFIVNSEIWDAWQEKYSNK